MRCGGWCLLGGQGLCPPFRAVSSTEPGVGDQAGLCSGPRGRPAVRRRSWSLGRVGAGRAERPKPVGVSLRLGDASAPRSGRNT